MKLRLILILFLTIISQSVLAVRWYEIEVILFEQATEERLNNESWETQPALPDLTKLRDIITQPGHLQTIQNLCLGPSYFQVKEVAVEEIIENEDDNVNELTGEIELALDRDSLSEPEIVIEEPFQLLADTEHELKDVYAQLRRRRGYRMLFHEAWRQPMASRRDAQPMRFYAGANFGDKFNYAGELLNPPQELPEDLNLTETISIEPETELIYQAPFKFFRSNQMIQGLMNVDRYYRLSERQRAQELLQQCQTLLTDIRNQQEENVWQIDGFIKFYAERFRHIETNLSLRIPGTEEISLESEAIDAAADEAELNSLAAELPGVEQQVPNVWELDDSLLTNEVEKLTEIREILAHYTMQQNRRIIDEKIHYFDHPLLGVIVQMRAYDPEEAAREALTGDGLQP